MQNQMADAPASTPTRKSAASLGFYVAILTAALTVFTFTIAILTPPLSGPFCQADCFEYPFADIAARFPRDYYWMYPAMVLMLFYLALMISTHYFAPEERKPFTHIGVAIAVIAAGIIVTDYFVQVSVIPPSLANGETDGIALLTQFNPHGQFLALEDIGYLLMGVSFAFAAPAFIGASRVEAALRWVLVLGAALAIAGLIGITLIYGTGREYRFEVFMISLDFFVLIIAGILMGVVFRRARMDS